MKDLASTVTESGLYPSNKIIERMEQLFQELEKEKDEALSVKDQEIKKLKELAPSRRYAHTATLRYPIN